MILHLHRLTVKITVMDLLHTYLQRALFRHGVKVGPGPRDPGPRDPGPHQSLKMGPQEPLQNLKVGS